MRRKIRALAQDLLGAAQAVHGGARDAAGIAGPLAAGEQAADRRALAVLAAQDPHRRRAARFRRGQKRVRIVEAAQLLPHLPDALRHRIAHEAGQHRAQVARRDAWLIRRPHRAEARCPAALEKVADALARRAVVAAARLKRGALDRPLERDAGERPLGAEILRRNTDKQRGVAVLAVTRKRAHAVRDDAARLGGRADDGAARAHAEGVDPAPVFEVDVQLVVRRAELRMPRKRAVLRAVDRLRAVLDARADRKGLRLHRDARLGAEHLERVARAVADREHHVARLQRFAHTAAREHNAAHRAVPHEQVLHLRVKAHFSAETPDLLADRAHGLREPVGSDVRLRLEEDFLRRAVLGERLQDKKDALVLCAGIQLAVRKRAGAALAELHVAFAVERAVLPEALHGVLPVLDRAAALHDDRPQPGAGQQKAGEHAGRPEADDDRTQG